MSTTLLQFLEKIAPVPDAALVFYAEGVAIRPEYHVTEIKLAHIRSLDCAGREAEWHETVVQLLDGPESSLDGGAYMSAAKFTQIAGAGLSGLNAEASGDCFVEVAPANVAARKHVIESIDYQDDTWVVRLGGQRAVCKPAVRLNTANRSVVSENEKSHVSTVAMRKPCCEPVTSGSRCCAG